MDKLMLLSIIFATIIIPSLAARDPSPRRGLAKTLVWQAIYVILYVLLLLYVGVHFIDTTRPPSMIW